MTEVEIDLIQHLTEFVHGLAEAERVFGPSQALRRLGINFLSADVAQPGLRFGQAKNCYANATAYALTNSDLMYAEGYAIEPELPIPIQHAWLVDRSGTVIDPTWRDANHHVYFGIAFKTEFLAEMLEKTDGDCGILVNFPLIRRHFTLAALQRGAANPSILGVLPTEVLSVRRKSLCIRPTI
ncbi:hypothetical protein [Pararhizobium qamdonense]|uniref:hypothetical protein n=1 Tax=Pararhizobium qamdonense TaxID=3031126 RepID=UPI0023E094AE|nr:hypothetical protein [Pararhizobium qamdonense]